MCILICVGIIFVVLFISNIAAVFNYYIMKKIFIKGNLITEGRCASKHENGLIAKAAMGDATDAYIIINGDVIVKGDLLVEDGFEVHVSGAISAKK